MSRLGSRLRCWSGVILLLSSLAAFGQFEDPETAMRRGDTALGQGRFDVAQSIYERTLRSSPNVNLGVNRCRNIAAANLRATHPNVKAGVDWLQRAVELAPNDNALRQHFADVLLNTSESTRAATQYRNLLAKDPENQQYVLGLASALRNLGQLQEAGTLLADTLKNHPEYSLLHIEYGRNLSYQREFKAAADQYMQVLKSDPANIAARLGLAKVFSWQGDQDKALVEYDKVLQKENGNYDALVGEAFSLIWTGRQNEALPILERANSRHPEDTEVRDALKRLGGVTIFTGETRGGTTPLPILPPLTKTAPTSRASAGTGEGSDSKDEPKVVRYPEKSPPEPVKPEDKAQPMEAQSSGHTVAWLVGMGVMMMVAVFAIAGFLLFVLPSMREKRAEKDKEETITPEAKPIEPWARLEEFARGDIDELPLTRKQPAAELKPLPVPPPPPPPPIEIVPEPEPVEAVVEQKVEEPTNGKEPPVRLPRRRRGAAERPWWRDLPTPEVANTPTNGDSAIPTLKSMMAAASAPPSPTHSDPVPMIDPYDADTVIVREGKANPLTPASEKPSHLEEELPPPSRPFTLVLSRALERAGDGHFEEAPIDESMPAPVKEDSFEDEFEAEQQAHQPAPVEPVLDLPALDEATRSALQGMTAVIVGCGVMVSHYRSVLRAAGVDVRTFSFWDLAMTSMRRRRADVLLIDGDTLDGFTPTQMYTSAHIEKYMFAAVLVGVASDEDRNTMPDEVVLPHSLTDTDLQTRLVDCLRKS